MTMTAQLHTAGIPPAQCAHYATIARAYIRAGQSPHVSAVMARALYRHRAGFHWHATADANAIRLLTELGV